MKKNQITLYVLFLSVTLGFSSCENYKGSPKIVAETTPIIHPPIQLDIQKAIDNLPSEGGTVKIPAGIHILRKGLHINKSNVCLSGEAGTYLKLADDVSQPMILIGSDAETPKTYVRNVTISCLDLDGNMFHQPTESDATRIWLMNSGIDVRMVENLWINNVNIHNARSGGLVVSWESKNVFIDGSVFHDNTFDGIALYASENIFVSNFYCYSNHSAGISIDNSLKHAVFNNGIIKNNLDVGIFAREAYDLSFHNLMLAQNRNNGCFISHNNIRPEGTGVNRVFFSGCSFFDNVGWGLWIASSQDLSHGNAVVSSLFSGNTLGPINIDQGGRIGHAGNVYNGK